MFSLTCGAAAFVVDARGLFALLLDCQARGLQRAAVLVRGSVGSADLEVVLARAHAHLALLGIPCSHALQSEPAAARSRAAAPARLTVSGCAEGAAPARVPQGSGGAALDRERSALTRVTRTAARTCCQHRNERPEDRNQDQKTAAGLHGGPNWIRSDLD